MYYVVFMASGMIKTMTTTMLVVVVVVVFARLSRKQVFFGHSTFVLQTIDIRLTISLVI